MEIIILLLTVALVFLSFYVRFLIKQLKNISADILVIREMIVSYRSSLEVLYNSEMFYGEPVIEALVSDTKELVQDLSEIVNDYDYTSSEEVFELDNSENEP